MLTINQQEKPSLMLIKWGLRVLAFLLVAMPNATNKLSWNEFKALRMAATIAGLVAGTGSAVASSALREQEPYKLMRQSAKLDAYDAVITNEVEAIASLPAGTSPRIEQAGAILPSGNDEVAIAANQIQSALADVGLEVNYQSSQLGCSAIRLSFKPSKLSDAPKVTKQIDLIHAACGLGKDQKPSIAVDKGLIQIDLPRKNRVFPQFLDEVKIENKTAPIKMLLGLDTFTGEKLYHLLSPRGTSPNMRIGGTSGGGKSMGMNAMILSLIHAYTPKQIQFVILDLKGGNYSWLEGSPWMWNGNQPAEQIDDAIALLEKVEQEREKRQTKLFKQVGAKDLESYNAKVSTDSQLPVILVLSDEEAKFFADTPKKERESTIILKGKIASLGRSAGVFSIIATQKPVVADNGIPVFPTTIKANHPNGLAFRVDSLKGTEVILGSADCDAQALNGKGDFYFKNEQGQIFRGQTLACPEDNDELAAIVNKAAARLAQNDLVQPEKNDDEVQAKQTIIDYLNRSFELEIEEPNQPQVNPDQLFEQIKKLRVQGISKTEIICQLWNCSDGGSNFNRKRENSPLNQYENLIDKYCERWVCELVSMGHTPGEIARIIWGVALAEVEARLREIYQRNYYQWSYSKLTSNVPQSQLSDGV